ncbi:MAG TPA: virulence factor [Thermohalobaculum sp.]|nr:virulence factor [Thermohalobaculum sp.]
MTGLKVVCWQEIPSLVEAKEGRKTHKVQLSQRFQELIDLIAMKRGLDGSDAYLTEWRKEDRAATDLPPEEAAATLAAEIEATYDEVRKKALEKS